MFASQTYVRADDRRLQDAMAASFSFAWVTFGNDVLWPRSGFLGNGVSVSPSASMNGMSDWGNSWDPMASMLPFEGKGGARSILKGVTRDYLLGGETPLALKMTHSRFGFPRRHIPPFDGRRDQGGAGSRVLVC